MKLAKALKVKNRLVGEIKVLQQHIVNFNSYDKENPPPYDTEQVLEDLRSASVRLVVLKAKIAAANVPIVSAILEIAEIKGQITMLQGLDTKEGVTNSTIGFDDKVVRTTYVARIGQVKADNLVKKLTERLDELQEQIDEHNATTIIKD